MLKNSILKEAIIINIQVRLVMIIKQPLYKDFYEKSYRLLITSSGVFTIENF